MHFLVQLQYRELGLAMLDSLWLGLELTSFCSCIVLLAFFLHWSLTTSDDLPKQVGHNAATDIILSV